MRGKDGVWCGKQRVVFRKGGFSVKDVNACSGKFSFGQGTGECGVVHDRSSCAVEEESGGFHECEPFGIDQMVCFGSCGNVQGEDVAFPQEGIERDVGDAKGSCRV